MRGDIDVDFGFLMDNGYSFDGAMSALALVYRYKKEV